jgi:hypothetical protein
MARVDETFVNTIKAKQVEHALATLGTNPTNPTLFEYGRSVGFLQGLKYAEELYLTSISEESKRE